MAKTLRPSSQKKGENVREREKFKEEKKREREKNSSLFKPLASLLFTGK